MNADEVWPPPPTGFPEGQGSAAEGRPRARLLLGIIVTGVLLSVFLGAFTNAIDAGVCPDYFNVVFDQTVEAGDLWKTSVIEGMTEAGVLGLFVSAAFALGAGLICRARLSYRIAFRSLIGVFAGALLAWVVGGLLGVSFAALSPALFDRAFGLPGGAYAWVGGSIDGGEAGSVLSLIAVLVRLHIRRRKSAVSSLA